MRKLWAFNRRPGVVLDMFNGRGVRCDVPGLQDSIEKELGTPTTGAAGTEAAGTGPAAAAPAAKPADDPEFELEFGEEGKKEKKKLKLSELHKGYMQNDDYTKKTQEVSSQKEQIKDLIAWSDLVKKDPEAVKLVIFLSQALESGKKERIAKAISAFEEKVEEKKVETEEKIEDLQKELEGLDPESPEYKFAAKILKQNQALLKKFADIEGRVNTTTEKLSETEKAKAKEAEGKAVEQASKVLNDTLASLTDPKTGEVKFDSDEGSALWKKLVLSHLKDHPQEYKTADDFVKTVKQVGKDMYSLITKHGEAVLAKHIKSKETHVPGGPAASGDPAPKALTIDNLQSNLEKALEEELSKK